MSGWVSESVGGSGVERTTFRRQLTSLTLTHSRTHSHSNDDDSDSLLLSLLFAVRSSFVVRCLLLLPLLLQFAFRCRGTSFLLLLLLVVVVVAAAAFGLAWLAWVDLGWWTRSFGFADLLCSALHRIALLA